MWVIVVGRFLLEFVEGIPWVFVVVVRVGIIVVDIQILEDFVVKLMGIVEVVVEFVEFVVGIDIVVGIVDIVVVVADIDIVAVVEEFVEELIVQSGKDFLFIHFYLMSFGLKVLEFVVRYTFASVYFCG